MKFQVTETFFNFDKHGNPKPVRVGTELPARVYNALTPQKQAKCKPVAVTRGPKNSWTAEEYECLVKLYLSNIRPDGTADHEKIATLHLVKFPTRAFAGAWMAVDQIRAHDSFVPQTEPATELQPGGLLISTVPEALARRDCLLEYDSHSTVDVIIIR